MYLFQRFGLFGNNGILTNLHSTMYLFQPASGGGQLWELCIYIPLCIYFNPKDSTEVAENITFTFHYVSISTISSDSATVAEIHLHSTMYLFQHKLYQLLRRIDTVVYHYKKDGHYLTRQCKGVDYRSRSDLQNYDWMTTAAAECPFC